jgi:class 3 adenylate cyclase/streptogramin lyase
VVRIHQRPLTWPIPVPWPFLAPIVWTRAPPDTERMQRRRRESVLATLLFTDIVRSSDLVAELGDRRWRILLSRHHALVRRELRRYGGREIDTAGDGFFASFENPGNAIRCAAAVVEAVQELGIDVRIGLHLGQAEIVGKKLGGSAVHIGARVMALAGPAEVLVTTGLRDVLPAPDFMFEDRGSQSLKGVPGEWHLFRVTAVEKPLPRPLEPGVAAERRAAVQAPPLWRRRYVPVAAVVAVVVAMGVGGAFLLGDGSSPPSPKPSPDSTRPAHALLRLDPHSGAVRALFALGDPQPPPPLNPGGSLFPGPGPRSITTGEGSIWVTNGGSDSVLRVDPISGDARVIPVSGGPVDVAVGQRGVWVISANGDLTRIDPGTNETTTTDISEGAPIPMGMAVGDRDSVYVASIECQCVPPNSRLAKVDPSSGSVAIIPAPPYPTDVGGTVVALDDSLWITAGPEVWQVDPVTGKVLKRVGIELSTGELVADQDGSSIWVTAAGSGRQVGWAIEIDASTGEIINPQPVGCCPGAIAVGEGYIWVTNSRDGTIERISEVSGDVAPPISVGRGVDGIAVGQGGVWVTVDS